MKIEIIQIIKMIETTKNKNLMRNKEIIEITLINKIIEIKMIKIIKIKLLKIRETIDNKSKIPINLGILFIGSKFE